MEGVIFVAGIYGVGKSTLCEKLSKELKIPFYSSGDLIRHCLKNKNCTNYKKIV